MSLLCRYPRQSTSEYILPLTTCTAIQGGRKWQIDFLHFCTRFSMNVWHWIHHTGCWTALSMDQLLWSWFMPSRCNDLGAGCPLGHTVVLYLLHPFSSNSGYQVRIKGGGAHALLICQSLWNCQTRKLCSLRKIVEIDHEFWCDPPLVIYLDILKVHRLFLMLYDLFCTVTKCCSHDCASNLYRNP